MAEYKDYVRWALQSGDINESSVYALLAIADRLDKINNTLERKKFT